MRFKICAAIWLAIFAGFGAVACDQISHWSEFSPHLKRQLVMLLIFMPIACLVGLGKLAMMFRR